MLDFWQNVKTLIKNKNTKQQAIADIAGISLLTMRGWITHDRLPDVVSAYKIAQALGVTVEYLVTGTSTDAKTQLIEEIQSVLERFKKSL